MIRLVLAASVIGTLLLAPNLYAEACSVAGEWLAQAMPGRR